jgi:hypothetical protein
MVIIIIMTISVSTSGQIIRTPPASVLSNSAVAQSL